LDVAGICDFQQSVSESLKEHNLTPETFENTFAEMELMLLKKLGFLEEGSDIFSPMLLILQVLRLFPS
jgi:hypothetical protein